MNIVPISSIPSLAKDTPLSAVSGVLENVYERNSGKSAKGGRPYSFQNVVLKDSTGSIKVTLNGRQECPKNYEGKTVTFSSVNGQNGLEGVRAEDNIFNGKTTRLVMVTNVAKVAVVGGNGSQPAKAEVATLVPIHGQTVGMAINNATRVLISTNPNGPYWFTPEFEQDLREVAGVYLRVSKDLELGAPPAPAPEDNFLKNDDPSDF